MTIKKITNKEQALTSALYLSLTAPTDEKAQQAVALADYFVQYCTEEQSDMAKCNAIIQWKETEYEHN
tara:strand:+ start:1082 stop:1285 length:204 start_codon:yes stop_codon:yes gene_type:complete